MTSPVPGPVRVLVVDDQSLIREGIASLLGIQPGIEVVGTAGNGREAVDLALDTAPDVILMDVRMPVLDGVDATVLVLRQQPDCRVLMLTTFDDEHYVLQALRAGASGYLLKDLPAEELAQAVRLARAGVHQYDPAVTSRLITAVDRLPPEPPGVGPLPALTTREVEVLRLLGSGASNREIAKALFLSEGTVKNHVSRILGRLDLRDRTQAAIYARNHGLT